MTVAGRALVLDACLAITFGQQKRLKLITDSSRRIVVGGRARQEVERPPAKTELDKALRSGHADIETVDLDDPKEQEALARYDAMPAFRDRGDAEVIALAVTRGYIVGSDDQAIRKQVRDELGQSRIAGTLDVIVWAIRDSRLTLDEATEFLQACDVGPALLKALDEQGRRLEELV